MRDPLPQRLADVLTVFQVAEDDDRNLWKCLGQQRDVGTDAIVADQGRAEGDEDDIDGYPLLRGFRQHVRGPGDRQDSEASGRFQQLY
jgi:hypothetical protein